MHSAQQGLLEEGAAVYDEYEQLSD